MTDDKMIVRSMEIKKLIQDFCSQYLNEEFEGYSLKLYDELVREKIITRGRNEIWAAAIVYVIARLNFLFDPEHEYFITADTICDFFNTKKSTTGNKATQIVDILDIGIGSEGLCNKEITDMLTFHVTPEGFILSKTMIQNHELVVDFVDGKEAEELENYIAEKQRQREQIIAEKKAQRAETNRKIAEEKMKKKYENQLNLFED